jgi:glycosyltransferase involved in cell wall biosynthesis
MARDKLVSVLPLRRWVRNIRDRIYLRRLGLSAAGNPLFSTEWYCKRYPDVAGSGVNPLVHYIRFGAAEGRDPSPLFSTHWYLERYPDVVRSGENPLAHYLRVGTAEGRDPNPLFSTHWYLERYPDVARSGENPLAHYLRAGVAERRDPNPLFSTHWYLERYPDVAQSGENPLAHYVRNVGDWYLAQHSIEGQAKEDPIDHYFRSAQLQRESHALPQRNPRVEDDWKFLDEIPATGTIQSRPVNLDFKEGGAETVGAASTAHVSASGVAPMNIVFVSYGPYDNNSAIHVTGFANALTALGHKVVVSAMGTPNAAGDFGLPRFRCVPNQQLVEHPEILAHHFGSTGKAAPDLIHCWTPRQAVRSVTQAVIGGYGCPYIIHIEDNEVAVAQAFQGAGGQKEAVRTDSMHDFIAGAAGATIIVDALRAILPDGLPCHLLEPGVDTEVFRPGLDTVERRRICDALDVPHDAWIIVYPGNIHAANADDMFSLYTAIHALNARGFKVHLIRTGIDGLPVIDPVFAALSRRYVTNLGFVRREWLVDLLKLADFFVQPGGPDDFNNYRLPSKIPEFLAMARPVVLPRTNIGLLMHHRVDALLMERGDAAEITECVEVLLGDPAFTTQLGQAARRFAIEHFNWQRSTKQLEKFYQRILRR